MTEISAFEAKTHFSKLLKRARDGEEITITLHGEPVARLVPLGQREDRSDAIRAMEELIEIRKQITLGDLKIKDLINEGRDRREALIDKLARPAGRNDNRR